MVSACADGCHGRELEELGGLGPGGSDQLSACLRRGLFRISGWGRRFEQRAIATAQVLGRRDIGIVSRCWRGDRMVRVVAFVSCHRIWRALTTVAEAWFSGTHGGGQRMGCPTGDSHFYGCRDILHWTDETQNDDRAAGVVGSARRVDADCFPSLGGAVSLVAGKHEIRSTSSGTLAWRRCCVGMDSQYTGRCHARQARRRRASRFERLEENRCERGPLRVRRRVASPAGGDD